MVLAIVGSVSLEGNVEAYSTIFHAINLVATANCLDEPWIFDKQWSILKPLHIVSGGARGIDSMAVEVAKFWGIPYTEYYPAAPNWIEYKKRNLKVTKACDALVRIVAHDSKTYGSGWTRDRAKEMDKWTKEFVI